MGWKKCGNSDPLFLSARSDEANQQSSTLNELHQNPRMSKPLFSLQSHPSETHFRPDCPDLHTNFALFWLDVSTELVHFQFPEKTHGKLGAQFMSHHVTSRSHCWIASNWDWHWFTPSSTRKWLFEQDFTRGHPHHGASWSSAYYWIASLPWISTESLLLACHLPSGKLT